MTSAELLGKNYRSMTHIWKMEGEDRCRQEILVRCTCCQEARWVRVFETKSCFEIQDENEHALATLEAEGKEEK